MHLRPAAVESARPSTEKARSLPEHKRREQRPSPHCIHAEDLPPSVVQEGKRQARWSRSRWRRRAQERRETWRPRGARADRLNHTDLPITTNKDNRGRPTLLR